MDNKENNLRHDSSSIDDKLKKTKPEEMIEVLDEDNQSLYHDSRNKFYDEIEKEHRKTGKIKKKIKWVGLLLMTPQGRIYIQQRSKNKDTNPGLYDKTVGGHVKVGYDYAITIKEECSEELGINAATIPYNDFLESIKKHNLEERAIIRPIEIIDPFYSIRIKKNGEKYKQPAINQIYIGYYEGAIQFKDGESCGIMTYSRDELKKEFETNPKNFTNDLKYMIDRYWELLTPLSNLNF